MCDAACASSTYYELIHDVVVVVHRVRPTGKVFKHDVIYEILQKGLPKYELVENQMDARVLRALFWFDNERRDNMMLLDEEEGKEDDRNMHDAVVGAAAETTTNMNDNDEVSAVASVTAALPCMMMLSVNGRATGLVTPRPMGGKKKAKLALQTSAAANKKAKVVDPAPDAPPSLKLVLQHSQSVSLERLAMAIEAKANIAREQTNIAREHLMFNFYNSNPTHAASVAWFEKKAVEFAEIAVVAAPTHAAPIVSVDTIEIDEGPIVDSVDSCPGVIEIEDDNNNDDDNLGSNVSSPVARVEDVVVGSASVSSHRTDEVAIANSLASLVGDDGDSSQDSLPPTQHLFAALREINHEDAHDSQETTL